MKPFVVFVAHGHAGDEVTHTNRLGMVEPAVFQVDVVHDFPDAEFRRGLPEHRRRANAPYALREP